MESGAKQGGSHVWPAIGAVAAVIGASGALIGGLAAAGVFDDDAAPPPPTGSPTTPTTTGPVVTVAPTAPPPTVAARVAATLVYNQGVTTGCSPTFDLSIGDRSYTPIGVRFQMNDLSAGVQEYTASGAVTCLDGTGCIASGSGVVDVAAGRTFEIVWEEVAFGECTLTLF